MNGIIELLTNKHWMINPEYVQGIRAMLQHNLSTHAELQLPEKVMGYPISTDGRILADYGKYYQVEEPFINFEIINGPITRNGDACSYGSRDHRDMMMMAADNPYCVGHIISINTPGGSAWAKNDYQQAIEYAHSKKQRVIAFVDGMCCSAGMYLAALCDERYYMHPKDQIGCIGVMAAFYTAADGSKNQFTDETYHEIYDPESFDKNIEFRDIANDGNAEKMLEELKALGEEFRADVKAACPKVKEEHLHGKVFDAEQVNGILMDGQKNLAEVMALFGKEAKLVEKRMQNGAQASARINMSNINNNEINMKEKFPKVFALLGVEEMECNEEGSFFNTGLLQALESKIDEMQSANAEAKAMAEQLTADMEQLKADHATALEEKENQISALEQEKADLNTQLEQLQNDFEGQKAQIEQLQADVDGAKASLETANATIAERDQALTERDQQIQDLNAEIDELKNDGGAEPQAGASPQNNGAGVDEPKVEVGRYAYDNNLSYEENMRRKREFEKK